MTQNKSGIKGRILHCFILFGSKGLGLFPQEIYMKLSVFNSVNIYF